MDGFKDIIFTIGPLFMVFIFPVLLIFLIRWLGAWMLRINDVIQLQKEILEELKKMNIKTE
jgi:hypothetical protein